jgi:hypothetical protein
MYRRAVLQLDSLQIVRGRLTPAGIRNDIVAYLLAIVQIAKTGALHRADMNKDVRAAVIRLDEAVAFVRIEPLYCTSWHWG